MTFEEFAELARKFSVMDKRIEALEGQVKDWKSFLNGFIEGTSSRFEALESKVQACMNCVGLEKLKGEIEAVKEAEVTPEDKLRFIARAWEWSNYYGTHPTIYRPEAFKRMSPRDTDDLIALANWGKGKKKIEGWSLGDRYAQVLPHRGKPLNDKTLLDCMYQAAKGEQS